MTIINIGFTPESIAYLLQLIERDRIETAEIAFATKDKAQYLKANQLQTFKRNILILAERQGFELQKSVERLG